MGVNATACSSGCRYSSELIPAEVDWTATAGGALDNIVVLIPKALLAVAAARAERPSLTIAAQIRWRDGLLRTIIDEMIEKPSRCCSARCSPPRFAFTRL